MFGSLNFSTKVVILMFICVTGYNCKIPDYIHVCHRNDPELATCINNSITVLKPYLKKGIPELSVPAIEPLSLKTINIRSGTDATRIASTLTDLKIWGPSSFIIEELIPNVDKYIFKFKVLLPELHVTGHYKMDTKILFLNLKGEGPANINLTNYRFESKLKGHTFVKDGEEYLKFEKLKIKIQTGETKIRLENLFNDSPVIGRATSDVINDNSNLFINEIKPVLEDSLGETFDVYANQIVNQFTVKELFL